MRKTLNLGVFGFGVVAQGLYHVINETKGIKAEIKKIVVKNRTKQRSIPMEYFSFDKEAILQDPEIDVVVELIDDSEAAFELLRESLRHGKAFVTANKKMIAEHLDEVYELQRKYGKPVLYEGAVCASIPIIRNLEEYYDNDLISSIEGILNGSTNYILTKVIEENLSYSEALSNAQQLGFAESDPTLDVRAYDPKFKLAILIAHAFGVFIKPDQIIHFGIDRINTADLQYAREHEYNIKLVGRAFKQNGKVYALIAPQLIDSKHPLNAVRNEYNAVMVEGAFAEKHTFIGKGAGSYPTASAVLSDISALTYGYQYEYKKRIQQNIPEFSNQGLVEVIVSDTDGAVSSDDFEQLFEQHKYVKSVGYKGLVTLQRLREWFHKPGVSVLLPPDVKIQALANLAKEVLETI